MKTIFFAIKRFFRDVRTKWLNYLYAVLNILAAGIIIYVAFNIDMVDITTKIVVIMLYIFSALLLALGILYLTPFGSRNMKQMLREDLEREIERDKQKESLRDLKKRSRRKTS